MIYIAFISTTLYFLTAFIVFKNRKVSQGNKEYVLFVLVYAGLSFFSFLFRIFETVEIVRVAYAIATFLPLYGYLWVCQLGEMRLSKLKKVVMYLFATFFFVVTFISNLTIKSVHSVTIYGYEGEKGSLFVYYSLYLMIFYLYAMYDLAKIYQKSVSFKKLQLRYIIFGLLIFGILSSITSLILPSFFKIYKYTSLDYLSSLVFFGFSTYAIIRHRLLGIKVILSKLYIYSLTSLLTFVYFFGIYYLLITKYQLSLNFEALIITVLGALLFSAIIVPVQKYVQKTSDVLFYNGYNPRSVIKDLLVELNKTLDLDSLYDLLTTELKKILSTEEITVILFGEAYINDDRKEKSNLSFLDEYSYNVKRIVHDSVNIDKIFASDKIIIADEISDDEELYFSLKNQAIKIVAPLVTRGSNFGVLILGEKKYGDAYTKEDIEFLELITNQVSVLIENSFYREQYSKIKNLA